MSRARFFLTGEPDFGGATAVALPLSAQDLRHASRVLRIGPGEEIDVVAPSGAAWRVHVTEVAGDAVLASPLDRLAQVLHPRITLFQGVAKGDKMDTIVRQAVEVGAAEIVPVTTSRTVVRLDERKRSERGERWRRVAEAAAKQARRDAVPAVIDPVGFSEAVALLGGYDAAFVLWEDHTGRLLSAALRTVDMCETSRVALFVGPEGGLAADEVSQLEAAGAVTVSLGPSILRTETAAVVALGLAVAVAGEAMVHDDER